MGREAVIHGCFWHPEKDQDEQYTRPGDSNTFRRADPSNYGAFCSDLSGSSSWLHHFDGGVFIGSMQHLHTTEKHL